jgi:hypothetical protein
VAQTTGVALATPMAALSGPIPKAPGFAGGYSLSSLLAQIEQIVVGDAQALLLQGVEHKRPHGHVAIGRQPVKLRGGWGAPPSRSASRGFRWNVEDRTTMTIPNVRP